MNFSEFTFGDYESSEAAIFLKEIGALISITSYIEEQIRDIFHELLYIHYFEFAAEVFDGINSLNQKKKMLTGLGKNFLDDDLNVRLKKFFVDFGSISAKRNMIAHGRLAPYRDGDGLTIKRYHIIKPSRDWYADPIEFDDIRDYRIIAADLAAQIYQLKIDITVFMKMNGHNLVKNAIQ